MRSDMTSLLLQYETDGLDMPATIELFQYLIDTGMAWSLQGSYGRMAATLIETGRCQRAIDPKVHAHRDRSKDSGG